MNMEAVLEGSRKCLVARNGDRRPLPGAEGTARCWGLELSREEPSGDAAAGEGERCRERGTALASSGFWMSTHSYLSASGRTWARDTPGEPGGSCCCCSGRGLGREGTARPGRTALRGQGRTQTVTYSEHKALPRPEKARGGSALLPLGPVGGEKGPTHLGESTGSSGRGSLSPAASLPSPSPPGSPAPRLRCALVAQGQFALPWELGQTRAGAAQGAHSPWGLPAVPGVTQPVPFPSPAWQRSPPPRWF